MSKIVIIYDTIEKTMILMKDGQTLADPEYASFDHYGDMSSDGLSKQFSMRIIHREKESDGIRLEHTATASDTIQAEKYKKKKKKKDDDSTSMGTPKMKNENKCKPGEGKKECNDRMREEQDKTI